MYLFQNYFCLEFEFEFDSFVKIDHRRFVTPINIILSEDYRNKKQTSSTIILPDSFYIAHLILVYMESNYNLCAIYYSKNELSKGLIITTYNFFFNFKWQLQIIYFINNNTENRLKKYANKFAIRCIFYLTK